MTAVDPNNSNNSNLTTPPRLAALQRDGFVKVPSLLAPESVIELKAAAQALTEQARRGHWKHIRTTPKQFPPWPSEPPPDAEGGIWGVQHLLHPDLQDRDVFASVYFSDAVLDVVKELLGLEGGGGRAPIGGRGAEGEDQPSSISPPFPHSSSSSSPSSADDHLVMELFNLLVSPSGSQDFELRWHRDDVRPDLSPEEEARQLAEKSPAGRQFHAQYNIALCTDKSLVVVPGSHRRARTRTEREADPYASELPGQVWVELAPGDAVFYDSNILHRGVYRGIDTGTDTDAAAADHEAGRLTLHGSVGLVGHGPERARQVLQHGVGEWVHRAVMRPQGDSTGGGSTTSNTGSRAEAMRQRLVDMGRGADVGYSLDG